MLQNKRKQGLFYLKKRKYHKANETRQAKTKKRRKGNPYEITLQIPYR